jgi:hypothetical protein
VVYVLRERLEQKPLRRLLSDRERVADPEACERGGEQIGMRFEHGRGDRG